ncbi:MAG: hypothetical protein GY941_20205 [Planctomycetes bacterium]|nr:hypothetical protein [Planctomycetota bacterium]
MGNYPYEAGYIDAEISKGHADRLNETGKAAKLREQVRRLYFSGFKGSADMAAERLGHHFLSIRPRCTELYKSGQLIRTGKRVKSVTGSSSAELQWFNNQFELQIE